MTRRAGLLDLNAQVADANRADREHCAAEARWDKRDLMRVGGRWIEADRVPHPSDVIDGED